MTTKQPLLLPLLGIVFGILAGYWFEIPLSLLVVVILLLLPLLIILKDSRLPFILLFLATLGAINYIWQIKHFGKNDLRNILKDQPAIATITGTIKGVPTLKIATNNRHTNSIITKFILNVESIQFRDSTTNMVARGKTSTIVHGVLDESLGDGSKIRVYGVIKPPPTSKIYGFYNYREDLKNKGIFYMLTIESPADVEILDRASSSSLKEKFIRWTDRTLRYGIPEKLMGTDLRLAMLFGLKTKLTDENQKNFMRSGTMHLFAVSGIHVGILSGAILVFLMSFNLSRPACGLITLPLLWFFTAATGWQASAIRAAVMLTILIGSWIFNRPSNLLNSLFAAAIAILLWQPSQLFQAGFQLSFAVVLFLSLLIPIFKKSLQDLLKTDPFLPEQLIPKHEKLLLKSAFYSGSALATSMAAMIGSLPLIAKYFNIISPISVVANIAIIPLGTLSMISTFASIIFGTFCLPLAEIFNWSGWLWSRCMIELSNWFSNLGFGWFYVNSPTSIQIFFYYLSLVFMCLICANGQWKKVFKVSFPLSLILLIASFLIEKTRVEANVVSFERGHSVYVQKGFSENSLVDCGTADDVRSLIEPLLISRGANKISNLFLTHGDINHISGAIHLAKSYFIENVFASNFKQRSRYYSEAIEFFNKQGNLRFIAYPEKIGNWEVISPDDIMRYRKADDVAIILRGNFMQTKILCLSDVSMETLDYLCGKGINLKSDILIGSISSIKKVLKPEYLNLINPETIIIAERSGFIKTDDFTSKIKNATARNVKVYWLNSYSGLTIKIKRNGYSVEPSENAGEFLPEMNEL